MDEVYAGYRAFVGVVRYVIFGVGVAAALIALVDWLVRTRRLAPFGATARFFRRVIDPLMLPVERRVIRAGGQPAAAPWWTLVAVVVGGLLLVTALDFLGSLFLQIGWGVSSPGRL